jgi:hypothetical protein
LNLSDYEARINALIAQNDGEAAVLLTELSKAIRCTVWNARQVGNKPKELADKADKAAFDIAGIGRQARFTGKTASGDTYPIH